ncbi:MAG: hypothetical protein KAS57_08715 [Gammaproteobacteria bacterium]|nr:hypothetical protein [Gammaproteobacteria bacterium]
MPKCLSDANSPASNTIQVIDPSPPPDPALTLLVTVIPELIVEASPPLPSSAVMMQVMLICAEWPHRSR